MARLVLPVVQPRRPAAEDLRGERRLRLRLLAADRRQALAVPRQRPAADGQPGPGRPAGEQLDPRLQVAVPARRPGEALPVQPGDDPAGGHHRFRQEHDDRLDAGLDQPQLPQAHPHARGPDRVHLHGRQVPDQPAGDRQRREGLRDRHEACGPRRSGRDPGGRNARPGVVRDGHPGGRDGPPRVRHDPLLDRPQHDRPHPRPVSRKASAAPSAAPWPST